MEQFKYVNYNVEPVSSNAFMGFHDTQISRENSKLRSCQFGKRREVQWHNTCRSVQILSDP